MTRASLRLVHIENDVEFARLSETCLAAAGFKQRIERCTNSSEALRYFLEVPSQNAPHVILLNIDMPHSDGLEVLHWLRHTYSGRNMAVYLLTASENLKDFTQAASDCLAKHQSKCPLFQKLTQNLDHEISLRNSRSKEGYLALYANSPNSLSKLPQTKIIQTKRLTISFSTNPQKITWQR